MYVLLPTVTATVVGDAPTSGTTVSRSEFATNVKFAAGEGPCVVGVKVTSAVQLPPGGIGPAVKHDPPETRNGPVVFAIEVRTRFAVPRFDIVSAIGALVLPTAVSEKVRIVGVADTIGAAGAGAGAGAGLGAGTGAGVAATGAGAGAELPPPPQATRLAETAEANRLTSFLVFIFSFSIVRSSHIRLQGRPCWSRLRDRHAQEPSQ